MAANFLYALQCAEIGTVTGITQKSVIAAFMNEDGTLRWGHSFKKALAVVFKANMSANPELFTRLIAYLPDLRETRRNIQYLTDEEVDEVKRALTEQNSELSLRDKAIGTLALNYGLRCCDIVALNLGNIDLKGEKINIRQQKTAAPLELPLTTAVGNAIFDYATLERPESDCEYIFLSEHRPFGRLASGSLGNIARKIMNVAGIRRNAGDRRGFHIFRHRLATKLLGNGVAQPVISRIAGHTSPDSLESYLSADFKHLKECAINIDRFPLPKGVFTNA
jgi:integrase